jgi:hypothetical protein
VRTGSKILAHAVTRNRRRLGLGSFLIGLHQACEALVDDGTVTAEGDHTGLAAGDSGYRAAVLR